MNDEFSSRPALPELDWLLNGLVGRIPGAEHAVVLSADGLALASSSGLDREGAEHLAAMASALHSLGRGVGTRFGKGSLHQSVTELEHGFFVVTEAGHGACLALLAEIDTDLGLIAYQMNVMVSQVRDQLSASPRTPSDPMMTMYRQ
ncbi:roadblock/LC7 domain-containing protein [Nocardia aurea]|uniref:roadblock/LC7 domain-containing protein n=1 Tax=Nocardia aurea TaxID=2144174 RepID=UPI000D68EA1D|nr:roadblock/LC7 domain-containing protein [Nocardia aurea]